MLTDNRVNKRELNIARYRHQLNLTDRQRAEFVDPAEFVVLFYAPYGLLSASISFSQNLQGISENK